MRGSRHFLREFNLHFNESEHFKQAGSLNVRMSPTFMSKNITYIKLKNDWLYLVAIIDWYD
jgi:hypothetical protein